MDYEVRPATNDDYAYCYRLTKRNMYGLFCRHWGGWVPAEFRKGFEPTNIKIIVIKGKRAGYLSIRADHDSIYIDNIQITSAWQGRGIGTALLGRLLAEHAAKDVHLTTFADNPAKRLYERMGFVVVEKDGMTIKMTRSAISPGSTQPGGAL